MSAEVHRKRKFKNYLYNSPRAGESWSGLRRWFVPENG